MFFANSNWKETETRKELRVMGSSKVLHLFSSWFVLFRFNYVYSFISVALLILVISKFCPIHVKCFQVSETFFLHFSQNSLNVRFNLFKFVPSLLKEQFKFLPSSLSYSEVRSCSCNPKKTQGIGKQWNKFIVDGLPLD